MDKIKIYCEHGAMSKEIKKLKNDKSLFLISFPYENYNRKIKTAKYPSELRSSSRLGSSSSIRVSDAFHSTFFEKIEKIIGKANYYDVRHVDTACREKCKIFISPDKKDIVNNATELFHLTGIKFFYVDDIDLIKDYIESLKEKS